MTFDALCIDVLGIDAQQPIALRLNKLKTWFQKHVSQDIENIGTEMEQWDLYQELATAYLTHFLPLFDKPEPEADKILTHHGDNALFVATSLGFDRVIGRLKLDSNLVNQQNKHGLTPLHEAAIGGHVHTVERLLTLGAKRNLLNTHQQNALFSALSLPIAHEEALIENKIRIFKALCVEGYPNLKHKDDSGNTVLHQIAICPFAPLISFCLMLEPKLAFIANNRNQFPIQVAILNGQQECIEALLKVKAVESLVDSYGCDPLHYAVRYGTEAVLQSCIVATSDINRVNISGQTPLMLAASLGKKSVIIALINAGAQVNLKDGQGYSILHHAVSSGDIEVVQWVMDNTNIDINAKDDLLHTPWTISNQDHHEAIQLLLEKRGARP